MYKHTERIGRYLQNEMAAEERNDFEKQLAYDKELQQELAIQKQIIAAINTAGLKSTFGKAVRTKFITRLLIRCGIAALVVGGILFYVFNANLSSHGERDAPLLQTVIDSKAEAFVIDNSKDTIIETDEGVVFGIPANAFDVKNKKVRLEIKTAISPYNIMRQGLSTMSNDSLLQTAGMFYFNGYDGNKPVSLIKKVDVSVPAENVNPSMQLFEGIEDGSGRINWVNPKPIEKSLRTYDITTLDFYPPYYIPVLKALEKDHTNKRYTDSLYYSFSGYRYPEPQLSASIEGIQGDKIFFYKCASCHVMGQDATGPNLQGVLNRWPSKQILKEWILNWEKATKKYPYIADKNNWSSATRQIFEGQITDQELESLIKWMNEWQPESEQTDTIKWKNESQPQSQPRDTTSKSSEIGTDRAERFSDREIDPSRIRAIWDKKFNNTIIATKEFEERLQYMHTICSPLFLVYLENLNKPMYEIDQFIADKAGERYDVQHKFLEFAARKDGGVILKDGMQKELSDYFQKKSKAYQEAAQKTWAKYQEELNRLSEIADDKRRKQAEEDFLRNDRNRMEEFCINLTDVYRQIGVKRTCRDTVPPSPPAKYYNIQIDTVGWKNLDMYVDEATIYRSSMTYNDPVTGKTATLTYKEVNIDIENQQQYDKVFVYLLPKELNSFQRIEQKDNSFKQNLNMLLNYDAIAIAYKEEKPFFCRQVGLQPGQYLFNLSEITEAELKRELKVYSKERSAELFREYENKLYEQQEINREVQLRKDWEFREQIMSAIWSCGEGQIVVKLDKSATVPKSPVIQNK